MISIIVPLFNEDRVAHKVINQLKTINLKKEIIIIDDASTDKTLKKIQTIKNIKIIKNKKNLGYGASIKLGLKIAKFDTCVIIDGDGTYPVNKIVDMTKLYKNYNHMIIGNRNFKKTTFLSQLFRYLLKLAFLILTKKNLDDINSGMRIFSLKKIKKNLNLCSNRFSFTSSITLIYTLKKYNIKYYNINYYKRVGQSKVKIFRDAFVTLLRIIKIFYNVKFRNA
jgi:glycosyltransferase involved in cell wall biosynthesis